MRYLLAIVLALSMVGGADALADMRLRLADWSISTEDGRPVPLPESR